METENKSATQFIFDLTVAISGTSESEKENFVAELKQLPTVAVREKLLDILLRGADELKTLVKNLREARSMCRKLSIMLACTLGACAIELVWLLTK